MKSLTVYKASAGSGKTFTLAVEYIKLLIDNPQSYRNILAVTFTNKAMDEMKMRILSQLYGLARRLPDSQSYMDKIVENRGARENEREEEEDFVSKQAAMALTNLLHNYSYFRVETIDTFFQSLLRNLARELNLTANLRVELNDTQVMQMAVDELIESLQASDKVLTWLMEYITDNINDDKSWNVIGQVKKFGEHIFKEFYKENCEQLRIINKDGFFAAYRRKMTEIRRQAKATMMLFASMFFEDLEKNSFSIDDLSYGKGGAASYFNKIRDGIFDESILGKRAQECLGDVEKWAKKTHPRRELIVERAGKVWNQLIEEAEKARPQLYKMYQSADVTLKHLNQLRLLETIEEKVKELNENANRFLLSDTPTLLHGLVKESDSPFIFEKIGTQLGHVMIDEFQDTSTVQWKNFKVLLQECMSHEKTSNLIVGDVKQSIYRWRAGDWRLLNNIENEIENAEKQLEIKTLATNFRSERRIIEFNNAFFLKAKEIEAAALGDNAGQLEKAYKDVEQAIPEWKEDAGLVQIKLFSNEEYRQNVLNEVQATITEMVEVLHIPPQDIAILVRKNKDIPLLGDFFMKNLPDVKLVSDEAFRLDASLAVNIIIQAMHLLAHPEDQLARAALVKAYQKEIIRNGLSDSQLFLSEQDINNYLPKEYTNNQIQLLSMPMFDLAERLHRIFNLEKLEGQNAYMCTFYDTLSEYLHDKVSDIDTFVQDWNDTLCSRTIQSDEVDGIRLISIHKSKGLEFKHVIIPFCDWELERTGDIMWFKPEEAPFNELPIVPVDYSPKKLKGTVYEQESEQEHLQIVVDNLNLLYVAFTRACQSLTIFGKRDAQSLRSGLIQSVLEDTSKTLPGSQLSMEEDKKASISFSYGKQESSKTRKKETTRNVFLSPIDTKDFHVETFDSHVNFRQSNKSRDFIEGEDDNKQENYIQIGNVLHYVFSKIHTIDDINSVLEELHQEGILYNERITVERVKKMLERSLSHQTIKSWFSNNWKLFNECTILSVNEETGMTEEHRPDRVMTDGKEVIVVDFKFGKPKEEYKQQVRKYMRLLTEMGNQHVKGYLWFVYTNQIEEV